MSKSPNYFKISICWKDYIFWLKLSFPNDFIGIYKKKNKIFVFFVILLCFIWWSEEFTNKFD